MYEEVKALRGNLPHHIDRFSKLLVHNQVSRYLMYYPEESFYFSLNQFFIKTIIHQLYEHYVALRIKHTTTLYAIEPIFHIYLYELHGVFLTHLKPQQKSVLLEHVTAYILKQPWTRIAYLIKKSQDHYFTHLETVISS